MPWVLVNSSWDVKFPNIFRFSKQVVAPWTSKPVSDLSEVVCGSAAHVVVHSRQYRNWFSGHVNSGKDHCSLRDSRQPGVQLLRGQVRHCQVDVVVLLAYSSAMNDTLMPISYDSSLISLQLLESCQIPELPHTNEQTPFMYDKVQACIYSKL